jgi:predicted small lipoprotein YifL
MTRRMTQATAALMLAGLVAGSLLACGRYGPPQPYPPGVNAPDDDDDEEHQSLDQRLYEQGAPVLAGVFASQEHPS